MTISTTFLVLPRSLKETLIAEAVNAGGSEICGFIAKGRTQPVRYVVANRARHTADRFDMDFTDQIAAFKQMRKHRARLFAIYHSHPIGEAEPSIHDIRGHSYPDAAALIVAPAAGRGARVRAWRFRDDETAEQPIDWRDAPWRDGFL